MKNFLVFMFFALSTFITGTGIEKMRTDLIIFGLVLIVFSVVLLFEAAIEEKNE